MLAVYLCAYFVLGRFILDIEDGKIQPMKGGLTAFEVFKGQSKEVNWNQIMNGSGGSSPNSKVDVFKLNPNVKK